MTRRIKPPKDSRGHYWVMRKDGFCDLFLGECAEYSNIKCFICGFTMCRACYSTPKRTCGEVITGNKIAIDIPF